MSAAADAGVGPGTPDTKTMPVSVMSQAPGGTPEMTIDAGPPSTEICFSVAPRLNAAGRLDDMTIGIQCLLADDPAAATALAARLDQLNEERRAIEARMQADVVLREERARPEIVFGGYWSILIHGDRSAQKVIGEPVAGLGPPNTFSSDLPGFCLTSIINRFLRSGPRVD